MKLSLLCLAFLPLTGAFTAPAITSKGVSAGIGRSPSTSRTFFSVQDQDDEPKAIVEENMKDSKAINSISAASATLCLLSAEVANAAGPDWGKIFRVLVIFVIRIYSRAPLLRFVKYG